MREHSREAAMHEQDRRRLRVQPDALGIERPKAQCSCQQGECQDDFSPGRGCQERQLVEDRFEQRAVRRRRSWAWETPSLNPRL